MMTCPTRDAVGVGTPRVNVTRHLPPSSRTPLPLISITIYLRGRSMHRSAVRFAIAFLLAQFASAAMPQSRCTLGATQCIGTIHQECKEPQEAMRHPSGGSRARWVTTGRSCAAGSGGRTTGAAGSGSTASGQCTNGDTRCSTDGRTQVCRFGAWNTDFSGGPRCDVSREEIQTLCQPGDKKCGPTNTVMICEDANFRGKYAWRDTSLRCN